MHGGRIRGWRKLARATWRAPVDPQFFGELDIDAGALVEYMHAERERTGERITMTHLIGKALAYALAAVPAANVRIARGRVIPRDSVDVFFIVSYSNGTELTGVKIAETEKKPAAAIARELADHVAGIEHGDDTQLGRGKQMMSGLPVPMLRVVLRLAGWLTSDLHLDLKKLGMPRDAFGSAMVTSVGMWGVSRAISPLAPYYKVPVLLLVGAVADRPVAQDGEVVVRPLLTLTATFDHRYLDGSHAAQLAAAMRAFCADPGRYDS